MNLPNAAIGPARRDPPAAPEVRRGQVLELEIEDLAFGGRALTRVNGLVVFVENALPGDRVVATVYRRKRHYAEARAERILRPAPHRIEPRCSHAAICGGGPPPPPGYAEHVRAKEGP